VAVIRSDPPAADVSRPRSSTPCPAASRCHATDRLQQLKLRVTVRRADVLDVPQPAMGRVDDLHRRGARRRPDRTAGPLS
jgi:hypothetical protein